MGLAMLIRFPLRLLLSVMSKEFHWELKQDMLSGAPPRLVCSTKLISHKSKREKTKTFLEINSERKRERETETMRRMSEQRDLPVFHCLLMNNPIVLKDLATLLINSRR